MRGIRRRTIGVRIAVLGAVGFLTAYGAHIVVAGLPAYGRRLGLGYGAIGLLLASYNLAEIVAKPLAGRLADRIGARPVMLWGTAFFSLSCLMYLVSPPAALPGLRVCQGAGAAALSVASLVLVVGIAPGNLGGALGAYNALKGAGYVAAPLAGGLLAARWGLRGAFLTAGLAGLAVLMLQMALVPASGARAASVRGSAKAAARLWPMFLANFTDTALLGILLGFLPVRADALGYGPRAIGVLLAGGGLAYLATQPLAGAWADRAGRRPLVLGGLVLGSAGVGALGWTRGAALGLATVLTGAGLGATWTNSLACVGEAAGVGRMGGDLGLAGSCKDAGDIAGPLGLGFLAGRLGLGWAFSLCAMAGLAAAGLVAYAGRPARST